MKTFIQLFVAIVLFANASLVFASKNNFQFQISNYHTKRQAGQTLDLTVRYAMKDEVDYSRYPDYRELQKIAASYLDPTVALPAETYWEVIAAKIGQDLMAKYPLAGISVQLLVYSNPKGEISEPGFHGPIYTIGDVIPLNQTMMPVK